MIRVWDVEQGTCLQQLTGHLSLTSGMQLRGNILVSGNADSTVKIWNIDSGKCLHTLAGKTHERERSIPPLNFMEFSRKK